MGVCCIVFDIDGMLFEFFLNFLNIEKNKILRFLCSIFHVFFTFYAISNMGGGVSYFFGNIEKCPFTSWLNGRWFIQRVDIGNFSMKWFPQIV